MFTSVEEFLNEWQPEVKSTEKLFANLTDASLSQKTFSEGRNLAQLAWHVATIPASLSQAGLNINGPEKGKPVPTTAKEIQQWQKKIYEELFEAVKTQWVDGNLQEEALMYGRFNWKKGLCLSATLKHMIHHRGQMTVLMRQAGLKVPGMYGPSKEEAEALQLAAK